MKWALTLCVCLGLGSTVAANAETSASAPTCGAIEINEPIASVTEERLPYQAPALSSPRSYSISKSQWARIFGKADIEDINPLNIGLQLSDGRYVSIAFDSNLKNIEKFIVYDGAACAPAESKATGVSAKINLPTLSQHMVQAIDKTRSFEKPDELVFITSQASSGDETFVYLARSFMETPIGLAPAKSDLLLRSEGVEAAAASLSFHGSQNFVVVQKIETGGARLLFFSLDSSRL